MWYITIVEAEWLYGIRCTEQSVQRVLRAASPRALLPWEWEERT
jgi:hypothetical protein